MRQGLRKITKYAPKPTSEDPPIGEGMSAAMAKRQPNPAKPSRTAKTYKKHEDPTMEAAARIQMAENVEKIRKAPKPRIKRFADGTYSVPIGFSVSPETGEPVRIDVDAGTFHDDSGNHWTVEDLVPSRLTQKIKQAVISFLPN